MRRLFAIALSHRLLLLGATAPVAAGKTVVDCDEGNDLQVAMNAAGNGVTLIIGGTCVGNSDVLNLDPVRVVTLKG